MHEKSSMEGKYLYDTSTARITYVYDHPRSAAIVSRRFYSSLDLSYLHEYE